ncbi:MAG: M48 family metallopeptidase [Patescibacteria group bacterium]
MKKYIIIFKRKIRRLSKPRRKAGGRNNFLKNKERARKIVEEKIGKFNAFYKFKFYKVRIKNQKTRWGSCSKKRNLNFNYKIVFLENKLADYLVVHELCHLAEFNHSYKFWNLVEKTIPDYLKINKELKNNYLLN